MFKKTTHPVTPNTDPEKYHALSDPKKKGTPEFVMSRSALADFAICPHKFMHAPERKVTKAMQFGDLVDCLFLTPDRFAKAFVISPETYPVEPTKKDPRTEKPWTYQATFCKEWREEQEATGFTAVDPDDASAAHSAIAALRKDQIVCDLWQASQKQVQAIVEWHDAGTGIVVPFKVLIDLLPAPESKFGRMIVDYKTTSDAEPDHWQKHVASQGYAYQAAVYLDALNAALGTDYSLFANIVQESSAPYEVARRSLSLEYIENGRRDYRRHLALYCRSLRDKVWPGYDDWDLENVDHPVIDGFREVSPPVWLQKQMLRQND